MNKSEKFWDRSASRYDQEEKKDEQTRVKIVEKTKKYLNVGDNVLDYGCGTGLIANEIAGNVKVIHAVDISSKMIEIAQKKANGSKIENIVYAHSTIFDERYKKGSFDVILGFYILHLSEDTEKAIHRIHELLKPGGLFISVTPCLGKKSFVSILLSFVSKIGLIPNLRLFKVPELEDSIANANFKIVETECLRKSGEQYFIAAKKFEKI